VQYAHIVRRSLAFLRPAANEPDERLVNEVFAGVRWQLE